MSIEGIRFLLFLLLLLNLGFTRNRFGRSVYSCRNLLTSRGEEIRSKTNLRAAQNFRFAKHENIDSINRRYLKVVSPKFPNRDVVHVSQFQALHYLYERDTSLMYVSINDRASLEHDLHRYRIYA